MLVWIYRFPLPLGVWEWLRLVIVALPGLFSYRFLFIHAKTYSDRSSKPQQKHRLGTVSKNLTAGVGVGAGALKSTLRGHNPRPKFCRGMHKTFVQCRASN